MTPPNALQERTFTAAEIDILAKQAGELEAFAIQQANAQVAAKILTRPRIGETEAALRVTQAEERARLQMEHMTVRVQLDEDQHKERQALNGRHTAALAALATAKS